MGVMASLFKLIVQLRKITKGCGVDTKEDLEIQFRDGNWSHNNNIFYFKAILFSSIEPSVVHLYDRLPSP